MIGLLVAAWTSEHKFIQIAAAFVMVVPCSMIPLFWYTQRRSRINADRSYDLESAKANHKQSDDDLSLGNFVASLVRVRVSMLY